MSVRIVVDSSVDMSVSGEEKVTCVPLTVRFGNDEFLDRVELGAAEFYEKLTKGGVMPSTSQANISDFERIYDRITENGDEAVVITLSSKLSGTYHSACVAAEDYKGKVYVIDSQNVSIGAGVLAEFALNLAGDGLTAWDIARRLTVERENIRLFSAFDTLEYLKRGGRLSSAAAFAGSLLALKPIITVRDGEVAVIGKARGSRNINPSLFKEIENCGGINHIKPCLFGYTGSDDSAVRGFIDDGADHWKGHDEPLKITTVGSAVGTHAGPGAIAVAFFAN